MQKLTRAEEELMQKIWDLEKAFLKDIIEAMPDPKPAQSTVATLLKIMETKGFIGHKAYGKSFEYFPIVTRKDYTKRISGNT